jgi:hypothetical protein
MERYSPAHRFPASFKVKRIIEKPERDLAIYFDYEVEEGLDENMAELVMERFWTRCRTNRSHSFMPTMCIAFSTPPALVNSAPAAVVSP